MAPVTAPARISLKMNKYQDNFKHYGFAGRKNVYKTFQVKLVPYGLIKFYSRKVFTIPIYSVTKNEVWRNPQVYSKKHYSLSK